jgi:hypothetical protein
MSPHMLGLSEKVCSRPPSAETCLLPRMWDRSVKPSKSQRTTKAHWLLLCDSEFFPSCDATDAENRMRCA